MQITYSDSMEKLAGRLAERIGDCRRNARDPLRDIQVIVPNRNLAKWLQLYLARETGICAGLRFPFVERALWELGTRVLPAERSGGTILLSAGVLQQAVAAALIGSADASLKPFRSYCDPDHPDAPDFADLAHPDCARRLWQLSGRLAAFFREYDFQRPRQVDAWLRSESGSWFAPGMDGGPPLSGSQAAMETAQRTLYRALFGQNGLLGPRSGITGLRTLDRALPSLPARAQPLEAIHLFGLSSLSPLYTAVIHRLSFHYDVFIYHFNVCMEYWEDIEAPWERIRKARRVTKDDGDETLDLEIENELLNAWGVTGRETMKLLADLDESQIGVEDARGTDAEPDSVLQAVQWSVRHRTSRIRKRPQDASLQVVACPGMQREVEMVHNSILASLLSMPDAPRGGGDTAPALKHSHNGLRLSDIAVLVPDMAAYQSAITSVFDARGRIPYNLVDSNASRESVYGRGLLDLLKLAGSAFTRRKVFELLYNPCLQAGLGAARADIDNWLDWADRLGVFHSYDRAHRRRQGLADHSRFTWHQALARIRLGRVVDDPALTSHVFGPPHTDIGTAAADGFSIAIERLFRRLGALDAKRQDSAAWKNDIHAIMAGFLAVPPDSPAEAGVRVRILDALDAFASDCGFGGFLAKTKNGGGSKAAIPLAVVLQYLEEAMTTIPCGRGRYLTDGVTIASLQPMRPIPFRHVYVLGLGEGTFPGGAERSTLDLRILRRRVGDSSRPDANRHLFLETLMTVRERLVLSYVSEDLQKDERKFPGSIIKLLKRFVAEHVLDSGPDSFRETAVPLDEADRAAVTAAWGDGGAGDGIAQTLSVYARLLYLLRQWGPPSGPAADQWASLKTSLEHDSAVWRDRRVRELLGESGGATASAAPPAPPPGAVAVTCRELAEFLSDPALAVLKRRLRIFQEDSSAAMLEDEPLRTQFPNDYRLIADTLAAFMRTRGDQAAARKAYDEAYDLLRQSSLAPDGVFAALDRRGIWDRISAQTSQPGLAALLGGRSAPQPLSTDDGRSAGVSCRITGVDGASIALTGSLDLWMPAEGAHVAAAVCMSGGSLPKGALPGRHLFEPLLVMLAERACGNEDGRTGDFAVVGSYRDGLATRLFRGIGRREAHDYLARLAHAYLAPNAVLELLPYAVIREECEPCLTRIMDSPTSEDDDALHAELLEAIQDHIDMALADGPGRGNYQPADVVELIFDQLRVPDRLPELIRDRFGLPWSGEPARIDPASGVIGPMPPAKDGARGKRNSGGGGNS